MNAVSRGRSGRRACGAVLVALVAVLLNVLVALPAHAAVTVSRAEVSGSNLRLEGTAIASRDIKVDGVVMGRSDSGGKFRIERSGYVSPADCTVDLTDGSTTVTSARLSGCTVSSPPPPPPPAEPAALDGLTVSPISVTGGSPSTGTVTLTAAPDSDLAVSLSSSSTAATVLATVTVPAGSTSAQFTVSTTEVTASSAVTLTATHDGVSRTATLTVNPVSVAEPAALDGLTVSPTSVTGGTPSTGTVTLTAAPDSDLAVLLSSDSAAATVPATVTVPAGSTSAQFSISTTEVAASSAVTITAARDGVTRSAFLTVAAPAALTGLTVSPTSVTGGSPSTGTITLTASQDSDLAVSLSSDSAAATVPATVAVPAGAAGVQFTISTSEVTATSGATITAAYDGVTLTARLTVNPPPVVAPTALDRLTVSPDSVVGGSPSTGTITFTAAAPAGGVTVAVSSNWAAIAAVPATVTVPAGATSAQFTISTTEVAASGTAMITAAYAGVTRSAFLSVNPAVVEEGLYFITPPQLPDATAGQAYLASIVSSDPPGPSEFRFRLVSGSVPPGTRFVRNTLENRPEARVTGTPTTAGTYTFTVQVTDGTGASARRTFTIVVNPAS